MIILGIETSCDETSLAVIKKEKENVEILSSCTFSQADIHAVFGGVVPEVASRNHMQKIVPLYDKTITEAGISIDSIDLIAVTSSPGLIGALFVGVAFAKGLGYSLQKPVIPIHHLSGHILSAELSNPLLKPPYTAVVVSGGHTHIYDVFEENQIINFNLWGRTIDDAAGEAFDKVAIMLGGVYPGGPYVQKIAEKGDRFAVKFPVALKNSNNFSFSGLKTSVLTKIDKNDEKHENIAASFQYTIAKTIAEKALQACNETGRNVISVSGGVACNSELRQVFEIEASNQNKKVYFPTFSLCNDNAAMIAYAALRLVENKNLNKYKNYDFAAGDTAHNIVTV